MIQEDLKSNFSTYKLKERDSLDYSDRSVWFICPELKGSDFQNPHVEVGYCESMCQGRGCKYMKECSAFMRQKETYKVKQIDSAPTNVTINV